MKRRIIQCASMVIILTMLLSFVPVIQNEAKAWSINQQNIADRADFFFNTTWVCQKTVNGWRDQYTFYEGETYHLPYGQPVNSGKFIGYGVELEDFLIAAADPNSVFYQVQSEWMGWTSVYYATDCAAFVAMCWGTVRQDCSTLPYYSTYKGAPNEANIRNILQLGDALDSTSVGHVVLVTDMVYDNSGNLIQIEITEQTPPQLKRTYFTPAELADKYGAEFGIYRYEGSVPAVPEWGYPAECTNYSSYCEVEITRDTPIMSLPCSASVNADSTLLGTAVAGTTRITTRMYDNTAGELWYRIKMDGDQEGYIAAGDTLYLQHFTDDIVLSDAVYPNAHVRGKTFSLVGNLYAKYNQLYTASYYIYKGFGSATTAVTGDTDYATSNAYTLKNSNIDYNTSYGDLTLGNHTIKVGATYKNYYATSATTYQVVTGNVDLAEEYFMVVSSTTSQNSCNHSYTQTVISQSTCNEPGISVFACSRCGKVYKETDDAAGHSYGDWEVTEATCTENGEKVRICSNCGSKDTQTIEATGHSYQSVTIEGSCQEYPRTVYTCEFCNDSYTVYPEEIMSDWQETKPEDVDDSMIEVKTQYRYADMEEITSEEETLEGCTLLGTLWEPQETTAIEYVPTWATGFDTDNALYSKYNVKPLTGWENDTQKLVIDTDAVTGYLYYHWCYPNSYYSRSEKSGQYTTFHAYYSTTAPESYRVDTSDWSYCTADETCSNTEWYFVVKVNTQSSTTYQKMYRHGYWQDYSQWSDTAVEASETRKVETRTVYRYPENQSTGHQFEVTTIDPTCTQNGTNNYHCTLCGYSYQEEIIAAGHNYETETIAPSCTENGYTTYICTACGDSYTEETEAFGHNYETTTVSGSCTEKGSTTYTCTACGDSYTEETEAFGHNYETTTVPGSCTEKGSTTYTCSLCGDSYTEETEAFGHSYEVVTVPASCTQKGSVTYTCKVCNDSYREDLPAPGHTYEVVTIPATCTQSGSVTITCSICSDTQVQSIPSQGHQYTDGYCHICGEAQDIPMPTIIPRYPTLSFEDEILLNVYFTGTNLDTVSTEDMGLALWTAPSVNGTIENAEYTVDGAIIDQATGLYAVHSHGIAAKNIGDDVYFKVYIRLTDGSYLYSNLLNYSPKTYAETVLQSSGYSNQMKALVVAMLRYGAQAQTYFDYKTTQLMDADLTAEQLALVDQYSPDMVADVAPVDPQRAGDFVSTGTGFSKKYPTISFESAFSINYYFTPNQIPAGTVSLYVWNQTDYEKATALNADNATTVLTMTGENELWAAVTGIAAKDIERTIYVAAVYEDTDGQTHCSGVLNYSLGIYCKTLASGTDTIAPFAAATAVYGYYAKVYFTK